MTQEQKDKILGFRQEGMSYTKIAQLTDISVNTIKSFCHRNISAEKPKKTAKTTKSAAKKSTKSAASAAKTEKKSSSKAKTAGTATRSTRSTEKKTQTGDET